MSHVDEGTLHAYLDGELPSSERAAVDAHLAQCAECRATLAEERGLLERANALLGSARPADRPVPPFEQLRRVPKRSPWMVRMPYAWAATIVVALGIGYYLAPSLGRRAADVPSTAAFQTSARPESTDTSMGYAGNQGAPAVPQASRVGRATSRDERREQATERAAPGSSADSYAVRDHFLDSGTIVLQPAPPPTPQLRNASPSAAAPAVTEAIILGAPRVDLNAPVTTQWPVISRGTAASLLGSAPVGLPGLTTRRIQRSPTGDGTVVVEQSLDSATVIQFFQRPAVAASETDSLAQAGALAMRTRQKAAAPARAADVARADRLARFVGRLRVEISGPLTTDSLNKLLEQVEPLPQR